MNTATTTHTTLRGQGFACPSCVGKIEKQLKRLPGVQHVTVHFASGRIEVDHDLTVISASELVTAVGKVGYSALVSTF
ncbi:heavy metal-associated domain-containing protein [Microbacterium horticulturae]|uniref:Copper chaperone CopZ n=1 Tax=Microbacterium horticulturae TaxID=3028316 RepID=A0ABY8BY09_9MICO|nr:heavy metal-associated domain-containing protein [Microbacterium sp. KACC 23027]WEG08780.1 heavy metal-associated domain-containing protein [Microbacterium sp. KACC 23027]